METHQKELTFSGSRFELRPYRVSDPAKPLLPSHSRRYATGIASAWLEIFTLRRDRSPRTSGTPPYPESHNQPCHIPFSGVYLDRWFKITCRFEDWGGQTAAPTTRPIADGTGQETRSIARILTLPWFGSLMLLMVLVGSRVKL